MDAKKLGQFIAEVRKEKEMTQAELASKLHVTDKAVSKWERGLGLPDINSIEPLADALGVSVAEVMQGEHIPADHVTEESASAMLTNAFDIVKQQRKAERTHILHILGAILLIDVVLFFGPVGALILVPAGCVLGGVALTVYGLWRRRNQLPATRTFVLALAMIVLPIVLGILLYRLGILTISYTTQ